MAEAVKVWSIKNQPIADLQSIQEFEIFTGKEPNILSIQLDWEGLTGTLDSTVQVLQKNDPALKWSEIQELSVILSTASDSIILENSEWGGEVLGIKVTKNNCTGGILNVVTIAKNK